MSLVPHCSPLDLIILMFGRQNVKLFICCHLVIPVIPSPYLQIFTPALLFSYILHLCCTWENVHTNTGQRVNLWC